MVHLVTVIGVDMSEKVEAEEVSEEESVQFLVDFIKKSNKSSSERQRAITASSTFLEVQADGVSRITHWLDIAEAGQSLIRSVTDICNLGKLTTHLISERSKAMVLPYGHADVGIHGDQVLDAFDPDQLN